MFMRGVIFDLFVAFLANTDGLEGKSHDSLQKKKRKENQLLVSI